VNGPPEVWIDRRIIGTMKTEPDLDAADGVKQLRYVSSERMADLVRAAAGGDEFFIQIELGDGGIMFALTNYGRIFRQSVGAPAWEKVDVPDFGGSPET